MTENSATYDDDVTKLYSPVQVACGVLLGGPVGLIYFLRANFLALGNSVAAAKTVVYGLLGLLGGMVLALILPDNTPSRIALTMGYVAAAKGIAERHQKTKKDIANSPEYGFHSNWKVFGLSLLCFVGSALAVFALALPLSFLFEETL